MGIDGDITRAEWMESARKHLTEAQQLSAELLGKWQFMNNKERLEALVKVQIKVNDTITMVQARTVFKNGD